MIEVQIILSPQGNVREQEFIGQLYIVNDGTGNAFYGNYDYVLDDRKGKIKGFPRDWGVWSLIHEILDHERLK